MNLGNTTNRETNSNAAVSARNSQYPSVKQGLSPMQNYRKRLYQKSMKRTDAFNTRVSSQSPKSDVKKFQELKQCHQRNQSKNSSQTRFSSNFGCLIGKIIELFPKFSKIASPKDVSSNLLPEDLLRAESVYNQLNFMYERAMELTQEEEHNATLKYSFENAEREISFYTNQINVFKNQLQTAALRE